MSTHVPGFKSVYKFFASFWIGKLATSSIRVKVKEVLQAIFIWIYDTFDNNCAIDKGFTKYFKESFLVCSD